MYSNNKLALSQSDSKPRAVKSLDVVCFGGGDWWYHNRAHIDMQLMRRFAKSGTVLYINSIVIQKPKLGKSANFVRKVIRKTKSMLTGLKKSDAGFWVYSPFTLPVHHISWARTANELLLRQQVKHVMRKLRIQRPLVWVACPGACDTALRLDRKSLVWQRTDRWEEFPNVDVGTIKKYDLKLKAEADLTIFASSLLYEQERPQCRKALYLDHGVDYEMFANAHKNQHVPSDIADIAKPIVGFFGGIDDHTSDIAFLENVIDLLPEISFVFVGKASVDFSSLTLRENVSMLGQKPYEQIPHYGKCFDVAIMPWRQSRWIEACNPIKLKEYLALGKAIVSTPFAELKKYRNLVYEAKTPKEFAQCIKKALAEDSAEKAVSRRGNVEHCTWDRKSQLVLEKLFEKNNDVSK